MTKDQFFKEYLKGRRDFSYEILQKFDNTFDYHLSITHPELFTNDLASLILNHASVVYKPLDGVRLNNLSNASIIGSNFLRAIFKEANLRQLDARYADLSGANLQGADLSAANFRNTHLIGVNLEEANLEDADLRYAKLIDCNLNRAILKNTKLDNAYIQWCNLDNANLDYISCLDLQLLNSSLQNTNIINSDFEKAFFHLLKFSGSKIKNTNLKRSRFSRTSFSNASAFECDFSSSQVILYEDDVYRGTISFFAKNSCINNCLFKNASIRNADLSEGDFGFSDFSNSDLSNSILNGAILNKSDLRETKFNNASINNTSFNEAKIGMTSLLNIDLNDLLTANLVHYDDSYVDHKSIAVTIAKHFIHPLELRPLPQLQEFLVKIGMPHIVAMYLVDSIRTLNPNQLVSLMRSTFISYGSPDEEFASQLNKDLNNAGVHTFFFPANAKFGEKLHVTMRRVNEYDRIILICSERSLDRPGLQYELEKVLERESKDGGESYLIPIVIDDYLFDGWKPKRKELRQEILARVVGDFRNEINYGNQLIRLIESLRKSNDEFLDHQSNKI